MKLFAAAAFVSGRLSLQWTEELPDSQQDPEFGSDSLISGLA